MRIAVKPVITSSVALVGASVIAITPIDAPAPTARVVESGVSLSASSLAYVPVNMFQQALSAPANMVAAMERLATALEISGSWNENHANNQWGWDEANPAMLKELINMSIPFPAFSEPWGRHLNWWATANLPMYAGCNYDCPDLPGMLDRMFKVPMSEFYDEDGYTFPVVTTPFNGEETPWSEQTVKLDPAEPLRSVWDSLTGEPTGIRTTTMWEFVTAAADLAAALQTTGHMPEWIAVREIETFFKHFLRPPVEELSGATELALATPEPLSPAPTLRALSLDTATVTEEVAVEEEGDVEEVAAEKADEKAADDEAPEDSDTPTVVETATNFLKGKFALAEPEGEAAEVDAAEDDVDTAKPSAADSDAADDEGSSTRVKHRKGDNRDDSGSASSASEGSDSGGVSGSGGSGGGDSSSQGASD